MNKLVGIYKITSPSSKVYVGQSWDINKRYNNHSRYPNKTQRHLYNSVQKYGWNNHVFEIIFLLFNPSQEELNEKEGYFWDFYKSRGFKMLNIKIPGAIGKHSEESKKLMSLASKGKKKSLQHAINIGLGHKGKKISVAQINAMTEPRRGIKLSIEHRNKISNLLKGVLHKPEHVNKFKIPILQYDLQGNFIKEWPCAKDVTEFLEIKDSTSITQCCKGNQKTAYSYKWKYKDDAKQKPKYNRKAPTT